MQRLASCHTFHFVGSDFQVPSTALLGTRRNAPAMAATQSINSPRSILPGKEHGLMPGDRERGRSIDSCSIGHACVVQPSQVMPVQREPVSATKFALPAEYVNGNGFLPERPFRPHGAECGRNGR